MCVVATDLDSRSARGIPLLGSPTDIHILLYTIICCHVDDQDGSILLILGEVCSSSECSLSSAYTTCIDTRNGSFELFSLVSTKLARRRGFPRQRTCILDYVRNHDHAFC